MERSSIISTVTLVFVVITMVFLLKTNTIPSSLLPEKTTQDTVPILQLPVAIKKIESSVVLPGGLNKTSESDVNNTQVLPADYTLTRTGVISETNQHRVKHGKQALVENKKLDRSAQVKADDLLKRQYFAHEAPDGTAIDDLVRDQDYSYIKIGENLALGNFLSNADVVTAWMNSPGHRANILDSQYTEIGIGVARGLYEGHMVYFAVQHFGRPRSSCPSIESNLKSQFTIAQKYLDELMISINTLKSEIDQGSGNNNDLNTLIEKYNASVMLYKEAFQKADSLRTKYNAEVAAYNTCLTSAQ